QNGVTGKAVRTLRSHNPIPRPECNDADMLFTPDGEYLAVITYKGHYVWERDNDRQTHPIRVFHVHTGKETARLLAPPGLSAGPPPRRPRADGRPTPFVLGLLARWATAGHRGSRIWEDSPARCRRRRGTRRLRGPPPRRPRPGLQHRRQDAGVRRRGQRHVP